MKKPQTALILLGLLLFSPGLRAAELSRLDWKAVNLERGMIELRAGQAKTASRRIVPISDNLAAWRLIRLVPRALRDVSRISTEIEILWCTAATPVVVGSLMTTM